MSWMAAVVAAVGASTNTENYGNVIDGLIMEVLVLGEDEKVPVAHARLNCAEG